MTAVYWVTFGAVAIYLLWLINTEVDRRQRIKRMRERRLRMRARAARTPQRWTP